MMPVFSFSKVEAADAELGFGVSPGGPARGVDVEGVGQDDAAHLREDRPGLQPRPVQPDYLVPVFFLQKKELMIFGDVEGCYFLSASQIQMIRLD